MESEHTQFSSSQPGSDAPDTQENGNRTPEEHTQPEHAAEEGAQNETGSARPHRRRRTSRSSTHRSRAATAEQSSEEAEHEEASTEPTGEAAPSAEVTAEIVAEQEPTASASDESAWSYQHWREQPPADWNPFLPHTSESQEPAFIVPGEPGDMTNDAEAASWSSPEAEVMIESNLEVIDVIPVEGVAPEAHAASAPEQASEAPQDTFRAPLSGVEVRPPRRYRFDRPSPTTQETPARGTHLGRTHGTAHAAQSRETRAEAFANNERSAAAAVEKEAAAEPLTDNKLEATIEREMTETPEIEADVVAAEELARATQAALEEEVAEALESFTAATTPTTSQRTGRRRKRRSGSSSSTAASTAAEAAEKAQTPTPQATPSYSQTPQPYTAPAPQPYSAPAPQ